MRTSMPVAVRQKTSAHTARPRVSRVLLAEAIVDAITATVKELATSGTGTDWRRAHGVVEGQSESYVVLAHLLYPDVSPHISEAGWAFVDALRLAACGTRLSSSRPSAGE